MGWWTKAPLSDWVIEMLLTTAQAPQPARTFVLPTPQPVLQVIVQLLEAIHRHVISVQNVMVQAGLRTQGYESSCFVGEQILLKWTLMFCCVDMLKARRRHIPSRTESTGIGWSLSFFNSSNFFRTSSAVLFSTVIDMPSALLWYLPFMWSRYDCESRKMHSHTLQ